MAKGSYLELRKVDAPPLVPVLSLSLLEMLDPKRVSELATEAETYIYAASGIRAANRMIIENTIRKALMEAVVNITNNV